MVLLGIIDTKASMPGADQGFRGGDPNMMGIQDSINVNHQCPLINLKKTSILGGVGSFCGGVIF